jgi:RNA recognition motif-containing protein
MPGTEQTFRLNWASFGIGERRPDAGPEHSIFVGDLAPDVTDYLLQETFRVQYPSVRGAKVVTDPNTGRSKGYGFVKFSDEAERNRAMTEMNGVYCSTRPMRISAATPKKTTAFQPYAAAPKGNIYLINRTNVMLQTQITHFFIVIYSLFTVFMSIVWKTICMEMVFHEISFDTLSLSLRFIVFLYCCN